MTTAARPGHRPAGRVFVLLVLAVLGGILGMHGLVASGVPQAHADPGHHASAQAYADPVTSEVCSHTSGDPDHLAHADGTCAAAGLGASYSPPAPSAVTIDAATESSLLVGATGTVHGRAPPGLSELQLLRI